LNVPTFITQGLPLLDKGQGKAVRSWVEVSFGEFRSYTSGSYHGMSAIRRILGCEAETAKGILPDEDGIMERGFFFAVVDGKPLDYGGENGERDVELLMAIRGSAMRGGEPIDLP
jgi:hypothetical protein